MKPSTTLLVILAVVVAYLLSPPFVAYVYLTIDPTESKYPWVMPGLAAFYAPLDVLAQIFPTYRNFLDTIARKLGLP